MHGPSSNRKGQSGIRRFQMKTFYEKPIEFKSQTYSIEQKVPKMMIAAKCGLMRPKCGSNIKYGQTILLRL